MAAYAMPSKNQILTHLPLTVHSPYNYMTRGELSLNLASHRPLGNYIPLLGIFFMGI
jgi:hypothetical protein